MRNFITSVVCMVFLHNFTIAQNLITNNSFETYTTCPSTSSQVITPPWFKIGNHNGSPDYMNVCGTGTSTVPTNFYGYQVPYTGNGYYGLITYFQSTVVREYLAIQLSSTLVAGTVYQVSFYVSAANNFKYATDHFGAYFSSAPIMGTNAGLALPLSNYIPQVENGAGNILSDTSGWMQVSGLYTANGTENYMTIGNFYTDINTQIATINPNALQNYAYYYLDEVSVSVSTGIYNSLEAQVLTIDPNPFSNDLNLNLSLTSLPGLTELMLVDVFGKKVLSQNVPPQTTKLQLQTSALASGIYFLQLQNGRQKTTRKVIKL